MKTSSLPGHPPQKSVVTYPCITPIAGSAILKALLEFAVLAVLMAIAFGIAVGINVTAGIIFGLVAFVIWSWKTGWVFFFN